MRRHQPRKTAMLLNMLILGLLASNLSTLLLLVGSALFESADLAAASAALEPLLPAIAALTAAVLICALLCRSRALFWKSSWEGWLPERRW